MKVILLENVKSLGKKGEIVSRNPCDPAGNWTKDSKICRDKNMLWR